jgi:hypothetical protein
MQGNSAANVVSWVYFIYYRNSMNTQVLKCHWTGYCYRNWSVIFS